jgi:hypothetical protein
MCFRFYVQCYSTEQLQPVTPSDKRHIEVATYLNVLPMIEKTRAFVGDTCGRWCKVYTMHRTRYHRRVLGSVQVERTDFEDYTHVCIDAWDYTKGVDA